jgi:hypothetical protein
MNAGSTMQAKVAAYLAERRREGFRLRIEGQQLAWFARFVDATGYRGPLTIEIASRWAIANRFARRLTAARRIEVLRGFARYCRSWDQVSEIPPLRLFGPGHRRLTPHIYRAAELRALMQAALELHPAHGLRGETCATVIACMTCDTPLPVADSNAGINRVSTLIARCSPCRRTSVMPAPPIRIGM